MVQFFHLVKHFVIMFRKYISRITSQGFRNHDTPKMGLCNKRQQLVAPSYPTRKTIYFFPKCLQKMVFPKKVALKYNLHILFSKNIILYFRREIKDDLSKKITWNNFCKSSERMVFPKIMP